MLLCRGMLKLSQSRSFTPLLPVFSDVVLKREDGRDQSSDEARDQKGQMTKLKSAYMILSGIVARTGDTHCRKWLVSCRNIDHTLSLAMTLSIYKEWETATCPATLVLSTSLHGQCRRPRQ